MPDPLLVLEAVVAAALTAVGVLLLCGLFWRRSHPALASVGSVLGVGMGFFLGCWWLRLRPGWPPREDLDRLLLVLFPAAMAVEVTAAFPKSPAHLRWLLRAVIAAGAAVVLLYDTSYLAELAGPGSREWTPIHTLLILGSLAGVLVGVWVSLVLLARRAPGISVPLAVALTCSGTAVTIMLSGYASGGQAGLVLGAAIAGTTIATLILAAPPRPEGALSLGVVGLFALLIMGRFFGQLATAHAALLFLGLLICWLPELPYIRRVGARFRGLLRLILAAVPVALALFLAQQKFVKDSNQPSPGSNEPSIEDYRNF